MKRSAFSWKNIIITIYLVLVKMISFAQKTFDDIATLDTSTAVESFMKDWIGKPYVYGGTNKSGIDCSGLTQKFYEEAFSKNIPRTAAKQFKEMKKIEKDSLKTGDLIFFRSSNSPSGWHVGIYVWENTFFHAANKYSGVIVSNVFDKNYQSRIIGYRR